MSDQCLPRGFVAYRRKSAPCREIVDGFAGIMTGVVSDALDRGGAMDFGIKPVGPGMTVVGPAMALKNRPTDSLAHAPPDGRARVRLLGDARIVHDRVH